MPAIAPQPPPSDVLQSRASVQVALSPEAGQRCTECIMDGRVPGFFLDHAGECNYCKLHDRLEQDWPTGEAGQRRLDTLVRAMKSAGRGRQYDCVIGVSGGTDSTYLLYLAAQLGLRPLAVHFDNGWNSEIAVSNIRKALLKLKIDLYTYVVDWEEFKDILLAYLRASLPWADAPTDLGITAALYRVAAREGVRHILVGNHFRSEGKMPTEWTYVDGRLLKAVHRRFGSLRLRTFPNLTLMSLLRYGILHRVKPVRLLNHVDYSKSDARALLARELDWEYYGGHHYESIYTRFAYSYLLPHKFGIDKRIVTLSAQVRSGEMSRDDALRTLHQPPCPESQIRQDVAYVVKKLGLTSAEFDDILAQAPRRFTDYPSCYPIIRRLRPVMKLAARLVLPWTPPFLHEMDARRTPAGASDHD